MRLCTAIDCQIVLAGLACIVLSVGYPILCGDPILWGRWEWDCGEWLDHCFRSSCWLLVTLERIKKEREKKKVYYITEETNMKWSIKLEHSFKGGKSIPT